MDDIKVKPEHVRAARMCMPGARQFFKRHGLSWNEFVKHGLDSKIIENTGDAMALEVVRIARGQ